MELTSSHLDKGFPSEELNSLPILAIDVDGVISLFGFDQPPPPEIARFELIDGTPHCLSLAAADRLRRLADQFEMVWATGWQDRANDRLSLITGIGPLPVIEFDAHRQKAAAAGTTAAHWKLDAIDAFCGERALAWIDDSFDESCFDWADSRESKGFPTLLVPTEPDLGFEEAQASVLSDWARALALPNPNSASANSPTGHLH